MPEDGLELSVPVVCRYAPDGKIGQENCQQADQRQETANAINVFDARVVGQSPEERRACACDAEGETEKQTSDEAHISRKQILRVNEDRRKC